MKRSTNRILTTHNGSLPRSQELRDLLGAKRTGKSMDPKVFEAAVQRAVTDVVKHQEEVGITVPNDGEQGRIGYATYIVDRLAGFGSAENNGPQVRMGEELEFPEYFARQRTSSAATLRSPCIGPITWKDFGAVRKDIDNLKSATKGIRVEDVFVSAPSPGTVLRFFPNRYYPSKEAYLHAAADAMKREYEANVNAGLILSLDCPDLASPAFRPASYSVSEFRKDIAENVEALNYATRDIQPDKMRIHVCWGAGEGPHNRDVELKDIVDILLRARTAGVTVVGANGRHEHEWKVWKDVKVPEGKVIVPGVIDSTCNFIEHPEAVAERIVRYANVLGRENVIAGVDCGFGRPLVDDKIAWAKLRSLGDGAALATKELWRK